MLSQKPTSSRLKRCGSANREDRQSIDIAPFGGEGALFEAAEVPKRCLCLFLLQQRQP